MGLALHLENLVWSFVPGVPFFRLPHLDLGEGAFASVMGPSGSGKSTLLYLLAGIERAALGSIRWGDFELGSARGGARDAWRRRHLGLVFQDFQLVPELSTLDNILLPATFERWAIEPSEKRRAGALLERLGVTRLGGKAATLSRGEQQRTAVARALWRRPPVVLADEPTASLDLTTEASVIDLLSDYCRDEGATLVVATHQTQWHARADRRFRLDHGALVEEP